MYLKKVEIYGFKSFGQKVEIIFDNKVTGIVGPNGSGKSNIVDAIRWVLGEQRVKTLRGGKMEKSQTLRWFVIWRPPFGR